MLNIYGKVSDINPDDSTWLQSMPGIKLLFHKDLHAKCYFNEKEAIITSMNLYMFSQQNNVEMGIYISKEKDEELYNQIANEVDRIKRGSEHRTISVQKVESIKPSEPANKNEPNEGNRTKKTEKKKNYSSSNYKATKELAELIGISSQKMNTLLTSNDLMYRKGKDWIATKKGQGFGGIQRGGQFGKFIVWPEEIIEELNLDVDDLPF